MTTTTQINITAKDSTAGAFASANSNLASLASSALKTTAGLAGIGLSIAGAVESVKGIAQATIQFQQFSSTLQVGTGSAKGAADAIAFVRSESQRLGLDLATAAEQFGKLAAASKGTALEGKATRDIFTSMSQAATVLGLSSDQTRGALNAFQQMISKGKVQAEELRGQLGERLPGAFSMAARAMGVTTAELDKLLVAGKVTAEDLLPKLATELDKTFGAQAEESAKGLASQINRMNTAIFDLKLAIGESGLINFLSSGIELATKLGNALTSAFGGGQKLSPIEKQVSLIKTLEEELESLQNLTNIPLIGDLLFDKKQADLLKFRIESATEDLGKMKARLAAEPGETVISTATKQAEELSVVTKKTISDAERFISALRKEADTVGLTAIETKRLEAAKLGVLRIADPLISKIEQVTQEMDAQKEAANSLASDLKKIESITESVKTEEEKLVDTQTELNRLLGSGLSQETYARAMDKAKQSTSGLEKQTKITTDQVDQLWTQAGRNIQSTLANSIFNFFDDGLKGMLKNVAITVGRITSEFAALKIAQGVGLGAIFGGASGAANASGGGGGISSILNGASMASGAASLFNTGFGATSALSSVGGMLPGSTGAFFGGMGGGAVTGVSSQAALMGASVAAVAGPAIAIAAVDQITRMLVGDKKLGGTAGKVLNFVPILGPLINGLFGRGPMKQGMTTLKGEIGAEGFESGRLQTRFDAKGGAFRSNKTDFATVDAVTGKISTDNGKLNAYAQSLSETSKQIIGLINETTKQVSASLYQMGEDLGLSTDGLDSFSHTIKLVSKAGKDLTEEQIGNEIAAITEELARSLIPAIDDLKKSGETTTQALTRLGAEFGSLENAAMNLGASSKYANELIKAMSFEARTSLIELAGGIEALSSKTAFFAANFLTDQEKLSNLTANFSDEMSKLGLSADITKDQFKALVQNLDISNETRNKLLDLAPAFIAIRTAQEQLIDSQSKLLDKETELAALRDKSIKDAIDAAKEYKLMFDKNLSGAFANVQKSADVEKNKLADEYNQKIKETDASISSISSSISKLSSLSGAIRGTVESIRGVSVTQAITNIKAAIKGFVNGGVIPDQAELQGSLNALQNQSSSGFSTKLEFARAKAGNAALVEQLGSMVDSSISADESQLGALEAQRMELEQGFLNETARLDALVSEAQHQVNVLMGIDDKILSLVQSLGNFNLTSGGNVGGVGANGNPSITGSQISDFIDKNRNDPMAIYNAAKANGVSGYQIAQTGKYTQAQIDDFISQNGLSPLDSYVPKTGNSSISMGGATAGGGQSAQQIKAMADDGRKTVEGINSMLTLLRRVTDNGSSLRTTAA